MDFMFSANCARSLVVSLLLPRAFWIFFSGMGSPSFAPVCLRKAPSVPFAFISARASATNFSAMTLPPSHPRQRLLPPLRLHIGFLHTLVHVGLDRGIVGSRLAPNLGRPRRGTPQSPSCPYSIHLTLLVLPVEFRR